MTPQPARFPRTTGRTLALLPAVLLILLHAVAWAVPPEPVHRPGIQDGADYDSLIQPLVLALSGVPLAAVVAVTPAGPSRQPVWASIPTACAVPAARPPQPRAPPLD